MSENTPQVGDAEQEGVDAEQAETDTETSTAGTDVSAEGPVKPEQTSEAAETGSDAVVPKAANQKPAPKPQTYEGLPNLPTTADAAAERIRVSENLLSITDEDGNPVDPDAAFREIGVNTMQAQVRLLEHTTTDPFERKITRLLCAKGRRLAKVSAQIIVDRIRAEQAAIEDQG